MFETENILLVDRKAQDLISLGALFSNFPGTSLLYSGGAYASAAFTFLGLFPTERLEIAGGCCQRFLFAGNRTTTFFEENPWDLLKASISRGAEGQPAVPDWIGYLAYEMGAFADEEKKLPRYPGEIPDAVFYRPAVVVAFDHQKKELTVHVREAAGNSCSAKERAVIDQLLCPAGCRQLIQEGKKRLKRMPLPSLTVTSRSDGPKAYREKVDVVKDLIKRGEVYQVNLSQRFTLEGRAEPFQLFHSLSCLNPAPFMGFLRDFRFSIVSASPERLLLKKGPCLETRPIKGTSPRGRTAKQDRINRARLLLSEKDKAELLMITDLMRNDLSKVSKAGSVKVDSIWHVESYANVHHLLSIIRAEAKQELHPVDILRHVFPGGSITGCPKLRAQEIIHALEDRARGVYTGSLGYFSANGDVDFNIAIRTLLCSANRVEARLGGAIVFDSQPQQEYKETLHKGQSLFHALL